MPNAKNDYNANVQRVFFVDEAHRSYSKNGEFFKNLMICDANGIYIALTGTPLLSKKERSNLKFGDYIHKYFYDKSIADGYTLRTMLANSEFIIMLNQASTDRVELAKLLNISDLQMSYITNVAAGEGLIKVGSALVPFSNRFPKNTELYKLMTTKPGEGLNE